MSSGRQQQQQQQQQLFNDIYTALILEESEKLYNMLRTEFTNRVMAAAASTVPFNKFFFQFYRIKVY
jgi:hypothetical protein